ncbi:PQQ-binding-like beta-propeller repeat protein [Amycolatopsis pithecellobii]|uniref:PQQ-binding-like beta-propeller repeat protein n=1 Tax=Amycolatopsis pithecellobii TaxID=664692 RepID=A0A6N7YYD0_9PSEU|nr:PQQ-binding-like beta-propeller repeat protein [Amycolatopsis pithecellobii]MTD52441.1 PQQ-binding-like beta-propeller repeat protein [Amycolatopsis pithecellobii]
MSTARRLRSVALALALVLPLTAGPDAAAATRYRVQRLVAGTTLHSPNGIALAPNGDLLTASLASETVSIVDPRTGRNRTLVGPRDGRSDDLTVAPSGEILWTDPVGGVVKGRAPDGRIRIVAHDLPGVNSIAFDRSGKHLYVGQLTFADALWEIDPAGQIAPRLVARDPGGLNAFAFGPDGMLYAPRSKYGEVARVDPRTGAISVIARGFRQPVSVRFDSRDRLYALDGATGQLARIGPDGAKYTVATLPGADDNMIISPSGHAYVSNMADSSISRIDLDTGVVKLVRSSRLAFPADLASDGRTLYVADSTALRTVDARTGAVGEIQRRLSSSLEFPSGISVTAGHFVLTSELIGSVQVVDRATGKVVREVHGLDNPADAVELPDGSLVISEPAKGRLLHAVGETVRPLAENLGTPTGLAVTQRGTVLAADAGGRLFEVEPASGTTVERASGLGGLRAVAVQPDGSVVVLDVAGRRVLSVNRQGKPKVLATGLDVGYLRVPYARSGGLAIGSDGTVYVAADRHNAIDAIRKTHR